MRVKVYQCQVAQKDRLKLFDKNLGVIVFLFQQLPRNRFMSRVHCEKCWLYNTYENNFVHIFKISCRFIGF